MRLRIHADFPADQNRFRAGYRVISDKLANQFSAEVLAAIAAIKTAPTSSGHLITTGIQSPLNLRRRNLRAFPFFILYSYDTSTEALFLGGILPSRSNPRNWAKRFDA